MSNLPKALREELEEKFMTIFKCLVNVSRATRDGVITMERVELLWKERTIEENDLQTQIYAIDEFLGVARAEIQTIDVDVEKEEVNF